MDCVSQDGRRPQFACGVRCPLENLPHLWELFNINRNLRNSRLSVASSSSPDIRNFKWPVTYEYSTGTLHTRHTRPFRHSRCAFPHLYAMKFDSISTPYSYIQIAILRESKRIDSRFYHLSHPASAFGRNCDLRADAKNIIFSRWIL